MGRKHITNPEPAVPPLPEKMLDVQGVMELLGVGRDKVFELMKEEGLPHIKWGARTLKFLPSAVARWQSEQSA